MYIHRYVYTYMHIIHIHIEMYMGGCPKHGPLLGRLNTRCRIILRTHKGTIIWTTTHIHIEMYMHILLGSGLRLARKGNVSADGDARCEPCAAGRWQSDSGPGYCGGCC